MKGVLDEGGQEWETGVGGCKLEKVLLRRHMKGVNTANKGIGQYSMMVAHGGAGEQ